MLSDYFPSEVTELLGPWLTTGSNAFEAGDIPPGRGLLAQNVEYKPGQVRKRYGFSPASAYTTGLGDSFCSMEGWLAPVLGQSAQVEFLAYLATGGSHNPGFNIIDPSGSQNSGLPINLYTPAGAYVAAVFAAAGARIYMTSIDAQGNGTDAPRVYSTTTIDANGGLDELFQPPIEVNSISTSDGGSASPDLGVTVGKHNFGFLLQTRNGYTTAPGPINGMQNFAPYQATVTIAGDALTLTINANWPTDAASVIPIMTTADNLAEYYIVPGVSAGVIGGLTSTINMTITIDDGTLAATATPATNYFTLFNTLTGTLKPSFIGQYSNRMVLCAPDPVGIQSVFISDPNNYQSISLARNVYYLPGDQQAICTFNLYGNLYIVGPHWTYQTIDNGGYPVTWAPPTLIDAQIGTPSPNGITVNSSQGIAWVADVDGLYCFSGGAYNNRPISYYQKSDWVRINWLGAAGVVRVVDSKDTQRVHVIVPLDGATTPSHVMSFDYSRFDGVNPETINYSLDTYGSYEAGCLAIIINPADHHTEVWMGSTSTAQPVLRQNNGTETSPYRDNGAAINSTYQTGLMPRLTPNVLHHVADHMRLTGNGQLNVAANNLDGSISSPLAAISLSPGPSQMILRFYHLLSEASTLTFNSNQLDAYFVLSAITHYSKEFIVFR